jgi:glycosyltransferase involved in cell wall biosynthesis
LPVLASRIVGIPELVEDGLAGLLFTLGDHKGKSHVFVLSYRSDQVCDRMAPQARRVAIDRLSAQERIADFLKR